MVVANPPYMGSKNMNKWLGDWIKTHYKDVKGDLFSCFMMRNVGIGAEHAQLGFMTPYVWMFIGTYEKLRKFVIHQNTITSLIQLEYSGFSGATVPICTFTLQKGYCPGYRGGYVRLSDFVGADQQAPRALEALANPDCGWFYRKPSSTFAKVPGLPIAYWLPLGSEIAFLGRRCSDVFQSAGRTKTHNNEVYLRKWWEVNLGFLENKWRKYCNGGGYSKWAGLDYDVINWSTSAVDSYRIHGGLPNMNLCNKPGLCWGLITSSKTSFRIKPENYLYSSGSPTLIASDYEDAINTMAFLNSSLCESYLDAINPTLNTTVNDVMVLPCPDRNERTLSLSHQCIRLVESDWDSFEYSTTFRKHPLL